MKIYAAARLAAMHIEMGENMAADEVHDIRQLCNELIRNRNSHKLGAIAGLDAVITSYVKTHFICLVDSTQPDYECIRAFIKILPKERVGITQFVNGIWASPELRGRGAGPALYSLAISCLGGVQSDPDSIGIMDVKTWRKLANLGYDVELYLRKGKSYVMTDYEWGADGIPVVDGTPVNKMKAKFAFYTKGNP